MARSVPWRRIASDIVSYNQEKAFEATIFILREVGPTGFLLQEEGHSKKFKVFLGDPHSCTCSEFRRDSDLCKHICWILNKKFRLKKEDPICWQFGLVEREIHQLLHNYRSRQEPSPSRPENTTSTTSTKAEDESEEAEGSGGIIQRPISEEDLCPICQDEMLASHLPVTFCRQGCGNSVHIRCMRVWSEHQKKQKTIGPNDFVSCPICRGDFATLSHLMREVAQNHGVRGEERTVPSNLHQGTECSECAASPIKGKLYKCDTCANYLLCGTCFNTSVHTQHNFIFRERSSARWQPALRSRSFPSALVTSLQSRELSEEDYDLLLQLDTPAVGSDLRQSDLEHLPSWRIRSNSSRLLTPGQQCRLCLMAYRIGDHIRRLPECRHTFHASCLDPWLLHRQPNCPIDGALVVCVAPPPPPTAPPVATDSIGGRAMGEVASGPKGSLVRRRGSYTELVSSKKSAGLNISGVSVSSAGSSRNPDRHPSARQPRNLPPLPSSTSSNTNSSVAVRMAPSIPTASRGVNNCQPSLGVGSVNNLQNIPFREKNRVCQNPSRIHSRLEKERSQSYASDPRLQNAIRKLELFAKSCNIPLE